MANRPNVVVFDVLETLLNLDPLAARLEEVGQPAALLGPWFMRFQRDAMALTLAGDAAPFEPVARQALRTETRHMLSEAEIRPRARRVRHATRLRRRHTGSANPLAGTDHSRLPDCRHSCQHTPFS